MDRTNRKQEEFILGEITVPYIEIAGEAVAITFDGTQLIIDTYFKDLSNIKIPEKYYFDWGFGEKGYLFTVINHLYKSSKVKTKRNFKKLLVEALPLLIDSKTGLIKEQPELSPAEMENFSRFLSD